jgi:hypothetical protein
MPRNAVIKGKEAHCLARRNSVFGSSPFFAIA